MEERNGSIEGPHAPQHGEEQNEAARSKPAIA